MARRRTAVGFEMEDFLPSYTAPRGLEYKQYSAYHFRIFDSAATVDVWTTGKYYVLGTDYGNGIVERGGEKGVLPASEKAATKCLDSIIYAVEMEKHED